MIRPSSCLACSRRALARISRIADVARVVDVERRLGQLLDGLEHLGPAIALDPALAQLVARHPGLRGDEAVCELRLRHLEREQRHRLAMPDGGVLGDVGGEARLAHRRPGGEYDQVPWLEAAREVVEVGEARRRAGEADVPLRQLLELVDLLVEEVVQPAHLTAAVLVPDAEETRLEALDQLPRIAAVRHDIVLDLAARAEDAAQDRVVLDDPRVVQDVADGRHDRGQRVRCIPRRPLRRARRRGAGRPPP